MNLNFEVLSEKDNIGEIANKLQEVCKGKKDPNREKIETVNSSDKIFSACLRISRKAIAGILKDKTNGATHYHTKF